MDLTSIELAGSVISAVKVADGEVRIRFEPAYLLQRMAGAENMSRWWQNLELVFEEAELLEGAEAGLPATCAGGDVIDNVYTYRDMIPVPLEGRGRAGCSLRLEENGTTIRVEAEGVRLEQEDHPRYIEHISRK